MSVLLKEPGFLKRALPVSVRTWHWMVDQGLAPQRAELLRGVIVEKLSKPIQHVMLSCQIFELLQQFLGAGFWIRKEDPITTHDSEPEPDVSVVLGSRAGYQQHPSTALLAVEVSVTTLAEDREMADIYAEAGVEEYWIINAQDRSIETYRDIRNGRYQLTESCGLGQVTVCQSLPGVAVDVDLLFADLPSLS